VPAGRFDIVEEIQRTPTPQRINELRGDRWDEEKVGIIQAAELPDGRLHPYDGGTRVRAKALDDPLYEFPTWIVPMTVQQAAKAFMAHNADSVKPNIMSQYKVGLVEGRPEFVAIDGALKYLGLVVGAVPRYGNGEAGVVAALAACKRIVERSAKDAEWNWARAERTLADVLLFCRGVYVGDTSAHHADLLQAVHALERLNPGLLADKARSTRLADVIRTKRMALWVNEAVALRETMGGSSSRGNTVAHLFARGYNARLRSGKLRSPQPS
jgi:hypothetical protein